MATADDELLAQYRDADMRGFDGFYRRNHALLFKYLIARLGVRADAEEAFQETFLRLHRSILSYDPKQPALPWVFTIARNVALDIARRRRRNVTSAELDIAVWSRTETALIAREELTAMLARLTDAERTLLERRFLDEADVDVLAAELRTSEGNVRQRLSRLLRRLRAAP